MLRSFHYAAFNALWDLTDRGGVVERARESLEQWANLWQVWSSWAFLRGYLEVAGPSPLLPRDREELKILLDTFLLEKAIYEVGYELNNRPDWLKIPLHGIKQILGSKKIRPRRCMVIQQFQHSSTGGTNPAIPRAGSPRSRR